MICCYANIEEAMFGGARLMTTRIGDVKFGAMGVQNELGGVGDCMILHVHL